MAEVYSFSEGQVHLWTGSHTASGNAFAFVRDSTWSPLVQWDNYRAVSGNYSWQEIGRQFEGSFTCQFTGNAGMYTLLNAATATHIKFTHTALGASGGWVAYSGRVHGVAHTVGAGGLVSFTIDYKANTWSAF